MSSRLARTPILMPLVIISHTVYAAVYWTVLHPTFPSFAARSSHWLCWHGIKYTVAILSCGIPRNIPLLV